MTPRHQQEIAIRSLTCDDLPAALRIQFDNYPPFLCEDEAAFASRLHIASSFCLAVTRDDVVVGYLLAHGWPAQSPPPIGTQLPHTAPREVLFIHDLAIGMDGRGLGLGRKLIARAFDLALADGLKIAELIAVRDAGSYWQTLGFSNAVASSFLQTKVAAYGAEARWMTRSIEEIGSR